MKSTRISETNRKQTLAGCEKELSRRKFMTSSLLGVTAVFGANSLQNASENLAIMNHT